MDFYGVYNGRQKDHWELIFGLELEYKEILWHTKLKNLEIVTLIEPIYSKIDTVGIIHLVCAQNFRKD